MILACLFMAIAHPALTSSIGTEDGDVKVVSSVVKNNDRYVYTCKFFNERSKSVEVKCFLLSQAGLDKLTLKPGATFTATFNGGPPEESLGSFGFCEDGELIKGLANGYVPK